jgi:hypothetical protein
MKETNDQQSDGQVKTWQSTQYANIVLHIPSGIYYARLRVKGKLIWRSLKTGKISIAKLRHGDFEREERKKAEAGYVWRRGTLAKSMARPEQVDHHKTRP